jgi:hypothetical protein
MNGGVLPQGNHIGATRVQYTLGIVRSFQASAASGGGTRGTSTTQQGPVPSNTRSNKYLLALAVLGATDKIRPVSQIGCFGFVGRYEFGD